MKLCKLLKLIKIHKNMKTLFHQVWILWKVWIFACFSALLEKNSIFIEDIPPEDDVTCKIWWQIFLFLSTHDSRYIIGSFKFLWKQMLILRLLKLPFKAFFTIFWNFKDPLAKSHCMNSIHWSKQTYKFS